MADDGSECFETIIDAHGEAQLFAAVILQAFDDIVRRPPQKPGHRPGQTRKQWEDRMRWWRAELHTWRFWRNDAIDFLLNRIHEKGNVYGEFMAINKEAIAGKVRALVSRKTLSEG